jgi:dTDP-4-dehydrorhamnose reductase
MGRSSFPAQRWLIIGGSGLLGHGMCQHLVAAGADVIATASAHSIDVAGVNQMHWTFDGRVPPQALLDACKPNILLYTAGLTGVDQCEADEKRAYLLHAEAPAALAAAAAQIGCRFIYISTDHLWDGTRSMVAEDEPLWPINAYARTKAAGEHKVQTANPAALILRTNFFGAGRPWRQSLSDWLLHRLRAGVDFKAFTDAFFTPIALPLLFEVIEQSIEAGLKGIYHACGRQRLSKYDFAIRLARWFELPEDGIGAGRIIDAGLIAPRPADMSLSTEKITRALGRVMPDVDQSFAAAFGPQCQGRP